MIQFPFLATLVFVGWVTPQLIGLLESPRSVPYGSLNKLILMSTLCLICCFAGDLRRAEPFRLFYWQFDEKRMLVGTTILTVFGGFFFWKMTQIAPDVYREMGGQRTGIITIYHFMATALTFGLAMACLLLLRRPNVWAFTLVMLGISSYAYRVILWGKRGSMAELLFIFLCSLWFQRKWLPSKVVFVAVAIVGTLLVNSIGEYRKIVAYKENPEWAEVGSIDFAGNVLDPSAKGNYELRNAAFLIESVSHSLSFDLGLSMWDQFVQQYVPGQLLGGRFKKNLMSTTDYDASIYSKFMYRRVLGTTFTGLATAFASFWYLGALLFFLISYVLKGFVLAAKDGNWVAQLLVIVLMTPALQAITHSTNTFFKVFPQILIFVFPLLLYSRTSKLNLAN